MVDSGWLTIEWPERYAHWHAAVAPDLQRLEAEMLDALQWWHRKEGSKPLLIVCRDPGDAALELVKRGLRDDPRVPRTYPALRLAIVPLPLDDPVLAELPEPPTTWRASLLHEAGHLQIALRPDLNAAPSWFHEGLAESFCGGSAPWPQCATWPLPSVGSMPSERLLSAWSYWARCSLRENSSMQPWEFVAGLGEAEGLALVKRDQATQMHRHRPASAFVRGRDAHHGDGFALAAPLPGQIVEVDLMNALFPLEPGTSVRYELRTGITGVPDAGLRIECAEGIQLRLRCDSSGGLAAWAERIGDPPRNQGTDRAAGSTRPGTPRSVCIEHRGAEIVLTADDGFLFRHALAASARAYPVRLVLYARGGVFQARRLP